MKDHEKGFYYYCQGEKIKDIAKRYGKSEETAKQWITRYHWVSKREECRRCDGSIDMEKVNSFVNGKGNLKPVVTKKASKINEIVGKSPYPDEMKNYIKAILTNSVRYLTVSRVSSDYECNQRIIEYFGICADDGLIPTVEGLWLCLGVQKDTYYDWINGKLGTVRAETLKRARLAIHEFNTQLAITGKMPQILYIFISKNHQEMHDAVEQVIHHDDPMGDMESKDSIAKRLESLPDD